MSPEKKIECYEHWLGYIIQMQEELAAMSPETAFIKLEQVVHLSAAVLRQPSIMDPVRQKKDMKRAMAAYRRGEGMTGEELRRKIDGHSNSTS